MTAERSTPRTTAEPSTPHTTAAPSRATSGGGQPICAPTMHMQPNLLPNSDSDGDRDEPPGATPTTETNGLPTEAHRGWSIRARRGLLFGGLGVGLAVVMIVSAASGQLHIAPSEVLGSLLHAAGFDTGLPVHPQGEEALWNIRFPRIALALAVGAALSVSGMLTQAVFGNPLAEPGVVGVSAGAAVGAAAAIVLGWTFAGEWTVVLAAFASGLAATFVVYTASRSGGRTEVVTLVLTGIAVSAVASAGLAFLLFFGDTQAREEIVFWQLGSLNGAMWKDVSVVFPVALAGIVAALFIARKLDLLSLGERSARHLGVNVEALRVGTIILVALLVAVAVAFTGIIAFVGLVVPHLMRMIIGPAHVALTIASALGGALLLSTADLVARTIVPYADLPIGMLTALVGGPFFFWLLRRTRAKSGGWA